MASLEARAIEQQAKLDKYKREKQELEAQQELEEKKVTQQEETDTRRSWRASSNQYLLILRCVVLCCWTQLSADVEYHQ